VTRFVRDAIARAGLAPVLAAKDRGDLSALRRTAEAWGAADLLVLGAVADLARHEEVGDVVRIHTTRTSAERDAVWIEAASDLELLRAVAVARILSPRGGRVGVDWSSRGLEVAQVALGFGASDLRGAVTRKSGLPILEGEARRVKGQGMTSLQTLQKRRIALLVEHAGRVPVFVGEDGRLVAPPREEASHA
jgi:hypothetical protein